MSLTLFTAPKPFRAAAAIAQHNAVQSWRRLGPGVQILLFGDEEGIGEAARRHQVEHVPAVDRNEFGTPLLHSIFQRAQALARHPHVCYVNADIILLPDLLAALGRIDRPGFLGIGRRTDLDCPEAVDFQDADWERRMRMRASTSGRLHEPSGMDYFVFPRGQLSAMPPFPVGRVLWDNWMVYDARRRKLPVIDLTAAVLAVHQNHDYGHVRGGLDTVTRGAEVERNWRMVGPDFYQLTIDDATWVLDGRGLHRATRPAQLLRRLLVYPALSERLRPSVRVARYLYRKVRIGRP